MSSPLFAFELANRVQTWSLSHDLAGRNTKRTVLRAPVPPSSRPSGLPCARRRLADAKTASGARETTAALPKTPRAFRIPIASSDAESFIAGANKAGGEAVFLDHAARRAPSSALAGSSRGRRSPELGYWLGVDYWGKGYATEAAARGDRLRASPISSTRRLQAGARVTNPASRRVLEKCGFQWTGVGLYRIRAIKSSAPIDRFRLERGIWSAIKAGAPVQSSRAV